MNYDEFVRLVNGFRIAEWREAEWLMNGGVSRGWQSAKELSRKGRDTI